MAGVLKNLLDLLKSNNKENISLGLELAKNYLNELQQRFGIQPQDCEEFLKLSTKYKMWDFKTHLNQIDTIFLIKVNLSIIPSFIYSLDNLHQLYLSHNNLEELSVKIGLLKKLEKLDLIGNSLVSLPPEIGQLRRIKQLSLTGNKLQNLPSEIGQLKNLEVLSLWHNQLKTLPAEIIQLESLQKLYLGTNLLQFLPSEMRNLQNLEVFVLEDNKLEIIPSEIGKLRKLRVLNLKNNNLKTIPKEIGELKHLEVLDLGNNQLTTLPKELKKLVNCDIYIGGNPELVLPKEFQSYEKIINIPPKLQPILELLESDDENDRDYVLYNQSLAGEFQQYFGCSMLEYKEIMDFLIENELWDFKTPLNKIEKLSVYGQALNKIPSSIYLLHNLKKLDLRNNFFKTLPKELKKLSNCKIYVNGNHNLVLPEELQDWENIIM